MCGCKVRRVFRGCLGILLILSVIQVMPFDEPFVENASAGSSWVQTSEADFNGGELNNVLATLDDNVTLDLQTKYIEDDFISESNINYKRNVIVDTAEGEVKLNKINKTFGGGSIDRGYSVYPTSDGGCIIAGQTASYGAGSSDAWLIKTDTYGNEQWNSTFGGSNDDRGYSVQQTSDGEYILTGFTYSFSVGGWDTWLIKADSSGKEQWNKTYGGNVHDYGRAVKQTTDGGFIIAGQTSSYGAGGYDFWLIKTDSSGKEQWNKTFGGTLDDIGRAVLETSDNGYLITGYTQSFGAGDIDAWLVKTNETGIEQWNKTFGGSLSDSVFSVQLSWDKGYIMAGNTNSYGSGDKDAWLIKTNATGIKQWDKTFGGFSDDYGISAHQTSNGGYILTGNTTSYGAGNSDVWLIKTDSSGNEQWIKIFGGNDNDYGCSVQQTSDDGYIVCGYSASYGAGGYDLWLIKTHSSNKKGWEKTFGTSNYDYAYSAKQTSDGGFIITGTTRSYGAVDYNTWLIKTDSSGNEQWNNTFGGSYRDRGEVVHETSDGGFIIAGSTQSYGVGSNWDAWLIKTDSSGNELWNKTFGGSSIDYGEAVQETSDGGYIITGDIGSWGAGSWDAWLIKTNETGIEQWNRTFGGDDRDHGRAVLETPDGGFIIAGTTRSYGSVGNWTAWLIKTDSLGTEIWNKTFNVGDYSYGESLQQTSDGGFIIAGYTYLFSLGHRDVMLIKTDSSGNEQWNNSIGGNGWDQGYSVQETSDGGYVIAGYTSSFGDGYDAWLIKTDSLGNEVWNKIFGGSSGEYTYSVQQTFDGGYIIAGYTYSYGAGGTDAYLIKTDSSDVESWSKSFGGASYEYGYSVQQTFDGGFIITGDTSSFSVGTSDAWLIKTDSLGNEQWNKTLGSLVGGSGQSVQQTSDGGYIIVGYRWPFGGSNYDVWLIRTDSSGNKHWEKTFGGPQHDYGYSVQQTSDDGFILAGGTMSFGASNYNVWLIKTDSSGNEQWNKTFGVNFADRGYSVQQTTDGGFIIAGYIGGDVWLIKTDNNGDEIWNKTFGGASDPDYSYSVQQTTDEGYIIAGETNTYGAGGWDVWLIKTDSFGNEQWNKTFGGSGNDRGYSVQQTFDGGFIITGTIDSIKTDSLGNEKWFKFFWGGWGKEVQQTPNGGYIIVGDTYSYGIGVPGKPNIWLVKDDSSWGEIISNNILTDSKIYSINNFTCEVVKPFGTGIKVQFSKDSFNWYNSSGSINGWDTISGGTNLIDLTTLGWNGSRFYYHVNFYSDGIDTPILRNINLSYQQYFSLGTLVSEPYNTGGEVSWRTINWNATVPANTEIKFQLRSATTQGGLSVKNFVGPDGTPSTFYTTSGTNIWSGHHGEQWFQYEAYLNTSNTSITPVLHNLTIHFNLIPGPPGSLNPTDNFMTNDTTPYFSWSFNDSDSTQTEFQVVIDNDSSFTSLDYNSGEQSSSNEFWQFPSGTGYTTMAEGFWFWKVRTKDSDGNWSAYSSYQTLGIDITAPDPPGGISAEPSTWNSRNSFNISWTNPIDASGIAGVYYRLDSPPTSDTDGIFVVGSDITFLGNISVIGDGNHTIYVWLKDEAGNVNYLNYTTTYLHYDTTDPDSPIGVSAIPSSWTNMNSFNVSWTNPVDDAGIAGVYYKLYSAPTSNDDGIYVQGQEINNISGISVLDSGVHTIYIWLKDNANNVNFTTYSSTILFYDGLAPSSPINLKATPGDWTSTNSFTVSWTNPSEFSGIAGAFYKLKSAPTSDTDGTYVAGVDITYIDNIIVSGEGNHTIYVWLNDNLDNKDYNNHSIIYLLYDNSDPDPPIGLTANPATWNNTNSFDISWTNPSDTAGITGAYYKLDSAPTSDTDGTYVAGSNVTSLNGITVTGDGNHTIYVWLIDEAGNVNYLNYTTTYLYYDATAPDSPIGVSVTPSNWINTNSFDISWTNPSDLTGIAGAYYRFNSPPTSNTDGTLITNPGINSLMGIPVPLESSNEIFIWLVDDINNKDYTSYNTTYLYYDSSPPDSPLTVIANPSSWTDNTQPTITFETTDVVSGIDHYEISIDGESFSIQTSPYILPSQDDGIHNITVRAFDKAGNYIEGYVFVYIDTTGPESFTPTTSSEGWTSNTQPQISFSTTDDLSDIAHYEISIDGESFSIQTSPYTLPHQDNGIHNITIRAFDNVGNFIEEDIVVYIDTTPPVITHTPVTSGLKGTSIIIAATVTDENSGVASVTLFFKKQNEVVYTPIQMTLQENIYSAEISAATVDTDFIEYYIKAVDNSLPSNTIYFGKNGRVLTAPSTLDDIDILIQERDTIPPKVLDMSPDGSDVPIDSIITITFSETMIMNVTQSAFSITPHVEGKFEWVEMAGITLKFKPDIPLSYDTEYTVTISTSAKDLANIDLETEFNQAFQTEKEADAVQDKESFWDVWEPIITGATVLASIIVFLIGFLSIRRKRGKLKKHIDRIEDTFNEYKKDPQACEQELIALREDIKVDVRKGKIEENHFLILDKRIDDYLLDLKTMEKEEAGEVLEEDITEPVSEESISEEEDLGGGFE
ncbi:MAG: Ig-like domain-containing protein [Thermoplasmata archaeon]|nr:MAG: Ig-like domain-containing protein [Thermoplasmata archaeon]